MHNQWPPKEAKSIISGFGLKSAISLTSETDDIRHLGASLNISTCLSLSYSVPFGRHRYNRYHNWYSWVTFRYLVLYSHCIKCFTNFYWSEMHFHPRYIVQTLSILQKDLWQLRKAEMASCHPASQWRKRNITRGSCMPQFQKHVLFLPQSLANIVGILFALNSVWNSKCVFLKILLGSGWISVVKRMNVGEEGGFF